jgi:DNA-binding transcriptional MerR regulator
MAGSDGALGGTVRLSIKEFADLTGLSEPTLRYYDKIGLFSPELRGENRYRYYSPHQVITVELIKVLIKVGVSLSAIKEMKTNQTPQSVLALLAKQEQKLNSQLRELQTAYSIIHTYRGNIQAGIMASEHEICIRELDETRLALGPTADFSRAATFYGPFLEFCRLARENQIDLHYPIGGYYEDISVFLHTPAQPTRFFSLDPHGPDQRETGPYLVAYNRGYYGDFGDLPQKLWARARADGLSFRGPLYVNYLLDEISTIDPRQYLAQIVVGVKL